MDQLILLALVFLVGLVSGIMGYRYFYKKDAARIEELAAQIKALGERV